MEFTCWICGLAIYNRDYPVPDPIMNCHPEWKKARASHERQFGDKPFSYHLDATALNISLSDEVWKSLFRMIYYKQSKYHPSGLHLSGIAQMPAPGSSGQRMGFTLPKTTLVPSDHDRAFIGVPAPGDGLDAVIPVRGRMLRSSSAAAPSHTDYYPQPAGYAIHARCWQLFERKVGWQSLEVVVGGLSKVEGLFLGPVTRGQGPFERSANRYNTVADPMYGTGMLEVLHGSMRRKTLRSGSGCTSSSIRYLSTQCNLPAEILFMILNYLTLDEVADCVTAFGEVLEGKYWQRLVGVDTVFEVQDMDPESLDWVYLVTEMRERNLFGETKGLWTRELILRRIRVIASA